MSACCYYYNINGMPNASLMKGNLSSRILFVVYGIKISDFLVGSFGMLLWHYPSTFYYNNFLSQLDHQVYQILPLISIGSWILRWVMALFWSQRWNGYVFPFRRAWAPFSSCWASEMAVSSPTIWWLHPPPFSFCHSSSVLFLVLFSLPCISFYLLSSWFLPLFSPLPLLGLGYSPNLFLPFLPINFSSGNIWKDSQLSVSFC